MVIKYIIALLAIQPLPFLEFSEKYFSSSAEGYLISEKSHPHITLAQFMGEEQDLYAVTQFLNENWVQAPRPLFKGLSVLQDVHDPNMWWVNVLLHAQMI